MKRLVLSLLAVAGCGTRVHTGGMGSTAASAPDPAVQLSVHQDFLVGGVAARGLVGDDQSTVAMGLEGVIVPGLLGPVRQPFSPHFALGIHALQWDWSAGDATFGSGSPYAQVGGHMCKGRRGPTMKCVGLSVDSAYHVRFGAENQLWLGGSIVLSRFHDPTDPSAPTRGGSKRKKKKRKKRRR